MTNFLEFFKGKYQKKKIKKIYDKECYYNILKNQEFSKL